MNDEVDGNAQSVEAKLTESKADCDKIQETIDAIPK